MARSYLFLVAAVAVTLGAACCPMSHFHSKRHTYEALDLARRLAREAGREDLLGLLDEVVNRGGTIDNCGAMPVIEDQRRKINSVIRDLGD